MVYFLWNPEMWRSACPVTQVDTPTVRWEERNGFNWDEKVLGCASKTFSTISFLNLPIRCQCQNLWGGRGRQETDNRWWDLQPELGILSAFMCFNQPPPCWLLFNWTAVPAAPFKTGHPGVASGKYRAKWSPCPEENITGAGFSGDLIIILTTLSKITKLILKKSLILSKTRMDFVFFFKK